MFDQLTIKERNGLYTIIVSVIGEDVSIKQRKAYFNEQTIRVVQDMVQANKGCNEAMKELVTSLITAGRLPARKWLRRALGRINDLIKASDDFKGFGCKVSVKIKWKNPIIMTTY